MNTFSSAATKLAHEMQGLVALARYPLHKDALIARLAGSMPSITIETTNICNANCNFCAYQFQERPTGVMSWELFEKVVRDFIDCGGGGVSLTPTVGDPLVDPHIVARLRWLKSQPAITGVGMYSNMISLARFTAAALVASGLDSLVVSTSGFDEAMYRRVYRSKMYRKVFQNIQDFAKANNAAGRPVDFKIDMRIDRPIREVMRTPDYRTIANLVGAENIGFKRRYDNWAGKIAQRDLSGTMKLRRRPSFRRPRISPCSELYTGPIVYWDGRVGACGCRDVNASELIIGDASKQHLGDIWFGEEIKKLRREFLTPAVKDICKQCTHYCNLSNFLRA
ncbi:MAG: radical SAM/SPASM domain-containing protein [Gemmatimonas sp.]